jgi:hypothetical protein
MKKIIFLFMLLISFQATCGTRALVVVIDLAEQASGHKLLYKNETSVALKRIKKLTSGHYDTVIVHNRKEATRENFLQSLNLLLNDVTVSTVDTIVYLHGKNDQYENGPSICFVGETPCVALKEISEQVANLANSQKKLRALYSDACWGKLHMQSWLDAGYQVVNGSEGVDANKSLDLKRFLRLWVSGSSFDEATTYANEAKLTRITDRVIKNANSLKSVLGNKNIRIFDEL